MDKKNKLTGKQILNIAKLANLKLSKKEVAGLKKQLSAALAYVNILNELNTKGVKAVSQATGLENVFREDKIEESLTQKQALSGAQSSYKGYFKIKSIFRREKSKN